MWNIEGRIGLLLREVALRLLRFADTLCGAETVLPFEVVTEV